MTEPKTNELMEKIVSLCKRRGFIFQSSEIYGGINGFWDYGPLGAELKRNVKEYWWRCMTQQRDDIAGLDASIIMHPKIWEASGHTTTFSDPMVDCLLTKKRFRADQIEPQSGTVYYYKGAINGTLFRLAVKAGITDGKATPEEFDRKMRDDEITSNFAKQFKDHPDPSIREEGAKEIARIEGEYRCDTPFSVLVLEGKPKESADKAAKQFYRERGIADPLLLDARMEKDVKDTTRYNPENGAELTPARQFNLMFKTYVGPVESVENVAYLRPETAQAIFAQFKNVLEVARQKVPFGIAQIGKAFRNEINPRNFTFRSREFEQMELEFFIKPDEVVEKLAGSVVKFSEGMDLATPQPNWGWEVWHRYWVDQRLQWYHSIGLPATSLGCHWQSREKNELAHYAKACVDIQFNFPFGTQELEGIAARGDFDLTQHQKFSGKSMEYFDEEAKAKYVPHVIEPSAGVDRLILALICNAYHEEQAPDEKGKLEQRVVMKFHPRVAPIKVAVFPLLKNRPELVKKALEVRDLLRPHLTVFYDETGAIGRRYRRQDEAGTPFGVTIDFDTLGEKGPELKDTVTLRDRDTMQQIRVKIEDLVSLLSAKVR